MTTQAIENPYGISVFGSAVVKVPADLALLRLGVSRQASQPAEAYRLAHAAAQTVREFLRRLPANDVNSSRVTLEQAFEFVGAQRKFVGYKAQIDFSILLRDLDAMEAILSGVIDAGANHLSSAELLTSRLKDIRATVRRTAVQAAQEKAENYCQAAGVKLGRVLHLEDLNPDSLKIPTSHAPPLDIKPDDDGPVSAADPHSITVAAAVQIAFAIAQN